MVVKSPNPQRTTLQIKRREVWDPGNGSQTLRLFTSLHNARLFGPYAVRGKVQKRTSGKAYGVIFTDLVSRAVHIEAVYGYDTPSFLLALSRFASARGWPQFMYSDPGSQLIGAEEELRNAWQNMDEGELRKKGVQNGMNWIFGPADSP